MSGFPPGAVTVVYAAEDSALPGADAAAANFRKIIAQTGALAMPVKAVNPRRVLAYVEKRQADAALLSAGRDNPEILHATARALWEADLFIIREFSPPGAFLLASEPAPAVGKICAVGGIADVEKIPRILKIFTDASVKIRDFYEFPEFAVPHSARRNLWVNFYGSLNSLPEQRALSGFETCVSGYRFFGNF